jgi:hypothetical protein
MPCQATQINHCIGHEKNEQLFVRFDGQDVRAIFTLRYKPVDNFEILTRLDDMGYGPDTQVQCHLDGEFMLLSIPDGKQTFQVNGDKITPGISVSNSEVGLASLSVSAFFLRLICTNGMVAKTEISASYRHVSTKILVELPQVFEKVSYELGNQRDRFRLRELNRRVDIGVRWSDKGIESVLKVLFYYRLKEKPMTLKVKLPTGNGFSLL